MALRTFCLFHKQNQLAFALSIGQQKNKLILLPVQGRELNAAQNQIFHQWEASASANDAEALQFLATQEAGMPQRLAAIDLPTIHELCEPGQVYELEEMIQNFSPNPADPWEGVALILALLEEPYLFHNKKRSFVARTQEEIHLLQAEQRKKELHEQRQQTEAHWANQLLAGQPPQPEDQEHWQLFLKRLKNFTHYLAQSQEKEHFAKLFAVDPREARPTTKKLLACLELAGEHSSWGRLEVERLMGPTAFLEDQESQAQDLALKDPSSSWLELEPLDCTHLQTFTVDNATTKDFDDALSFAMEGANLRLWSHIADVANKLPPEHPLFQLAEDRIASLYTPKGSLPMLPRVLSEDAFSLRQGPTRSALTLEGLWDSQGQLLEAKFYRSLIRVAQNLSYEQVDQWIAQGQPGWKELSAWEQQHTQQREAAGALNFERRELVLDISQPERIRIQGYREDTPASRLIQEIAIWTNHQAARYCQEQGLGCLYRNQPPYGFARELAPGERPQLKDLRIQPAKLGLSPEGHAALGLKAYTQSTSPIRRFPDLVTQLQIAHHLAKGQALFFEEQLASWAVQAEEKAKAMAQLERALVDHWKIKYLAQNTERTFAANVIRQLPSGMYLVNIKEVELTWPMRLDNPPEEIEVKIQTIHPDLDQMELVALA